LASTSQNPSHSFSVAGHYSVNLAVTDSNGTLVNATPLTITVTQGLSSSSAVLPDAGDVSLTVAFTGTPAGGTAPYSYAWTFGDGTSSASQSPSHTYSAVGGYSAIFSVTDARGVKVTASPLAITVNPLPAAVAGADRTSGDAPLGISFTGSASGGTAPYSYVWTFGDGSGATGQSLNHTFAAGGTYLVNLTVTDGAAHSASASPLTIAVHPALGALVAANPMSGVTKLRVTFSASGTGGLAPYTFAWNFGDGVTASGAGAIHTYRAGTFYPTVTVGDAAGGTWRGTVGVVTVIKHVRKASPQAVSGVGEGPAAPSPQPSPPPQGPSSPVSSDPGLPLVSPPAAPPTVGGQPPAAGGGDAGGQTMLLLLGSLMLTGGATLFFLRWLPYR
jgi:PKD repeat protein